MECTNSCIGFLFIGIGLVVQLVRIHACHAWGHEFESRPDRQASNEANASFYRSAQDAHMAVGIERPRSINFRGFLLPENGLSDGSLIAILVLLGCR